MRIRSFFFASLLCLFTFSVLPVSAATHPDAVENKQADAKQLTRQEFKEAYEVLKERTHALKEARKHAQTMLEKQKINEEIRDVKEEAKTLKEQVGGGIYIGSAALVVLILLLLLL